MKLGAISTVFVEQPLREAARRMHEMGLEAIEIGTGGFFPKNHCDPAELLADEAALETFQATLAEYELEISAFCIHGEPLHPDPAIADPYRKELRDTYALAAKLGVTRLTLLSGLPEAVPGDQEPNWILYPYPPRLMEMYEWQWNERLIPYWKEEVIAADDHGVRLCMEMHAGSMVFRTDQLLRIRDEVGPVIGCNLDPSHLIWQGMELPEVIRALGDSIYHVHAKDSRLDPHNVRVNGILDPYSFQDKERRSWIFRTVGYGNGEDFWREFVSSLQLAGYDDVLSIEHEDPLIDPEEGFELAVKVLQNVLIRKPPARLWYE